MTDDSTEWVTVKIHEQVRDDASDDDRTYTEIMRAGLEETPTPDGEIPAGMLRSIVHDALDGVEIPAADMDAEVREQLERIEAAASTAEERTGSIERQLEDMGGR